jgi:hypothetical protein
MKRFLFLMLCASANTLWAQNEAKPTVTAPIQCLTAHIDADKDPKPVLLPNEDKFAFEKRQGEWQRREEQRNPKSPDRAIEPVAEAPVVALLTQTPPEPQRIDPIQYIIDKGVTTKEKIHAVAPHFPLLVGEPNNENIADYLQTNLRIFVETYPREMEAFYNKIISPDELAKIPEHE